MKCPLQLTAFRTWARSFAGVRNSVSNARSFMATKRSKALLALKKISSWPQARARPTTSP